MLIPTLLLTTLSTLSVALPSPPAAPSYPPMKTAHAFRLVFNVSSYNRDFPGAEAVHGSELWPRDFFGPESTRGTVAGPKSGAVFFQTARFNGGQPITDDDRYRSSIQAQYGDFFLGLFDTTPFVPLDQVVAPFRFYKGSLGTESFQLNLGGNGVQLYPFEQSPWNPRFVVCNETIQFPTGPAKWKTFGIVSSRYKTIPDECVQVTVLPECDKLGFVSENAERKAVFEAASEVRCYEDVKSIEWGKYSYN